MAEEGPLPPGWVEELDESTGVCYYANYDTSETTWTRPTLEEEEPLPEGWTQELDEVTGAVYYANESTQETTWTRPSSSSSKEKEVHDSDAEEDEPADAVAHAAEAAAQAQQKLEHPDDGDETSDNEDDTEAQRELQEQLQEQEQGQEQGQGQAQEQAEQHEQEQQPQAAATAAAPAATAAAAQAAGGEASAVAGPETATNGAEQPHLMTGFMYKLGEKVKNWKLRFFALKEQGGKHMLMYSKSKRARPIGCIPLENSEVYEVETGYMGRLKSAYHWALLPAGGNRTYIIEAPSAADRAKWIEAVSHLGGSIGGSKQNKLYPNSFMEGYMEKQPPRPKNSAWKTRYFALGQKMLVYFKDPHGDKRKPRNAVMLTSSTKIELSKEPLYGRDFAFVITTDESARKFIIRAGSEASRAEWVSKIRARVGHIKAAA